MRNQKIIYTFLGDQKSYYLQVFQRVTKPQKED